MEETHGEYVNRAIAELRMQALALEKVCAFLLVEIAHRDRDPRLTLDRLTAELLGGAARLAAIDGEGSELNVIFTRVMQSIQTSAERGFGPLGTRAK